jgi:predicted ATPase
MKAADPCEAFSMATRPTGMVTFLFTDVEGSSAENLANAASGRKMLIVLDNCEHVLDAAATLTESLLSRSPDPVVLATSRESLGLGSEQVWPVPLLGVADGSSSAAVELFLERAIAVAPGFAVHDAHQAAAVSEICARLDGIPLAIELAAARMVAMTASDVRGRLDDRFRLLSGSRRVEGRHQTLLRTVAWSDDLLDDDEKVLLNHCAVFSDGFDLASVVNVVGADEPLDKYVALDILDSLVRKSLVVFSRPDGRSRYELFETIRQFGEKQLTAEGTGHRLIGSTLSSPTSAPVSHGQQKRLTLRQQLRSPHTRRMSRFRVNVSKCWMGRADSGRSRRRRHPRAAKTPRRPLTGVLSRLPRRSHQPCPASPNARQELSL